MNTEQGPRVTLETEKIAARESINVELRRVNELAKNLVALSDLSTPEGQEIREKLTSNVLTRDELQNTYLGLRAVYSKLAALQTDLIERAQRRK